MADQPHAPSACTPGITKNKTGSGRCAEERGSFASPRIQLSIFHFCCQLAKLQNTKLVSNLSKMYADVYNNAVILMKYLLFVMLRTKLRLNNMASCYQLLHKMKRAHSFLLVLFHYTLKCRNFKIHFPLQYSGHSR